MHQKLANSVYFYEIGYDGKKIFGASVWNIEHGLLIGF